jgi:quercetin dioxygenase-like cupin family protein
MQAITDTIESLPETHHRAKNDLPYVTLIEGLEFKLLQVNMDTGLWVVQTRFAAGLTIPRHKHTGDVFAVTFSGSWKYLEYPEVNTVGSYLYEPAGSTHTLHVPASNTEPTEVWFAINGANLNLDDDGNVESIWDPHFISALYLDECRKAGLPKPDVIGL